MVNIPEIVTEPLDRNNLASLNKKKTAPISKENVFILNARTRRVDDPVQAAPRQPTQQGWSQPGPQARVQQPMPQGRPQPGPQARVQQPVPQGRPQPTPQPRPQQPMQQGRPQPAPQPRPQNRAASPQPAPVPRPQPTPAPTPPRVPDMVLPRFANPLRKGQKSSLDPQNRGLQTLKACFGWNIIDARCEVDASAFLTAATGKVPGDEWFVFYGQEVSPDNSVKFMEDPSGKDREIITVNLQALNSQIQKVVFVITINEAYENHLNFSMLKDVYVRILDGSTNQELVSYKLDEYYANVTSMTIGELYLHNGQWKFNPVGNGVNRDLAGQCAMYGVEIA